MWPAASVNARCTSPIPDLAAATWLDQNRPVEQMIWAPGEPMLIADRHVSDGGWIDKQGVTTFNLHRPPLPRTGETLPAHHPSWAAG
jgi:hypothetical protein